MSNNYGTNKQTTSLYRTLEIKSTTKERNPEV